MIALSCPLGLRAVSYKKNFPEATLILKNKPYSKSLTDQTSLAKMVGYWPFSFVCVLMDLDSVLVHKHMTTIQPS